MILGVIFLNEHLSWQLVVGAVLIISGIVVVNRKPAEAHTKPEGCAGPVVADNEA